jgi:hypothetical protein
LQPVGGELFQIVDPPLFRLLPFPFLFCSSPALLSLDFLTYVPFAVRSLFGSDFSQGR